MHTLILADMWERRALWVWALIGSTTGSACILSVLVAITTAARDAAGDATMTEGVQVIGANVVTYTMLATVGILGSIAALTMEAQSREHALWVVLGIPRRSALGILLGQLVLLGAVGAVFAIAPGWGLSFATLAQWSSIGIANQGPNPTLTWWHVPLTILLSVTACVWGGWAATWRAARAPEMNALRDTEARKPRVGWFKLFLAGCCLISAVAAAAVVFVWDWDDGGGDDRAAGVLSANLLLVTGLLLVGPWVFRPLMWAWTSLIPAVDPAWHLARSACRTRAARSVTTILPFALALSVFGVLFGGGNVLGGQVSMNEVLILLGWVLVVAWVGGIAVIGLVGRERLRDSAVVSVAGASRAVVLRTVVYEGLTYAVTAVLFGLAAMGLAITTVATSVGLPLLQAVAHAPWWLFGLLASVTAATTCGVVVIPAWRHANAPLTESLRL